MGIAQSVPHNSIATVQLQGGGGAGGCGQCRSEIEAHTGPLATLCSPGCGGEVRILMNSVPYFLVSGHDVVAHLIHATNASQHSLLRSGKQAIHGGHEESRHLFARLKEVVCPGCEVHAVANWWPRLQL